MKKRIILPLIAMAGLLGLGTLGAAGTGALKAEALAENPATVDYFAPNEGYEFKTGTKMLFVNVSYRLIASNTLKGVDLTNVPNGNPNIKPDENGVVKTPVNEDCDYAYTIIGASTVAGVRYYNIAIMKDNGLNYLGYNGEFSKAGLVFSNDDSVKTDNNYLWSIRTLKTVNEEVPVRTEVESKGQYHFRFFENGLSVDFGNGQEIKYIATYVYEENANVNALADYIMEDNTDGQCTTKFAEAKTRYLALESGDQEVFKTSTNAGIKAARERYEAWAINQGQKAYEAGALSNAADIFKDNNVLIATIAISGFAIVTAASLFIVRRKKLAK